MDMMATVTKSSVSALFSFQPKTIHRPPPKTSSNTSISSVTTSEASPAATLEEIKQILAHLLRRQGCCNRPPESLRAGYPLRLDSTPAAQFRFLVRSYIEKGRPDDALKVYFQMRNMGSSFLDNFVVPSVLKACGQMWALQHGREVHGFSVKAGSDWDVFVRNSLIQMYSECGSAGSARQMFDEMADRDLVSWSTMIRVYGRSRHFAGAMDLISEMLSVSVRASEVGMLNMINIFAEVGNLEWGRTMHAYVVKNSSSDLMGDVSISTSLVDMYVKCGSTCASQRIFDRMTDRNIASWTSMISGHIHYKNLEEGMKLFQEMEEENVIPNEITMLSLIIECGTTGALELGKWMHAYMLKTGFPISVVLGTALIEMYVKCGEIERARSIFDRIRERDVMTWTAMISGYAKGNNLNEALQLLALMKLEEAKPNIITMVNLLSACAEAGALDIGKWLHACIDKEGNGYDVVLTTSLIDLYSKCGDIGGANEIFSAASTRDICMWNAMISGLALHGHGREVLKLFSQMEEDRMAPNYITCIGVLHACSHSGLVVEGKQFFNRMEREFGLVPKVEHYGCMVDLLGRAGSLDEAYEMIKNMPIKPNIVVWGALLAGCKLHDNSKLGEEAAGKLIELEPQNCGYNVLLSNIYALENRWNDVAAMRRNIKGRGINKVPGLSSIEVNGFLHEFMMGDDSHPQTKQIHEMLAEMNKVPNLWVMFQ